MQIEKTDAGIASSASSKPDSFHSSTSFTRRSDIQSGINKLRYATLIGIKQAKNKPLRKVALAEVQSAMGETCRRS